MLEARDLGFRHAGAPAPAVKDFSITLEPGIVTGLTGPSGTGKSTAARLLCGHIAPDTGTITLDGAPLPAQGFNPVQLLAQTPVFAVNQRWTIDRILTEAWNPDETTREGLGVRPAWGPRYPHELSGGELQRVSILRSLAPGVRYLVADEISSMLDPITQAEIWGFLIPYVRERGIGVLAISHDDALLGRIADRVVAIDET